MQIYDNHLKEDYGLELMILLPMKRREKLKDMLIEMNTISEVRIIEIIPSRLTLTIHDGIALFLYK